MDWGLMETNGAGDENRFLREEIVYSSPGFYYFGIIEDFILRFAWTFTVSVTHDKVLKSQVRVKVPWRSRGECGSLYVFL